MNKLFYKLVFDKKTGSFIACAECVKSTGKGSKKGGNSRGLRQLLVFGAIIYGSAAYAELPRPKLPKFATVGQATYTQNGNNAYVNQVGSKSILNWNSFNISNGNSVTFQQVDANNIPVVGANFVSLNRIYDSNPSVIAGAIKSAPGQTANITLVNQNGIAFLNGAQVNLASFSASSLNIADHFITDSFIPGDGIPQFIGTGGFVKVYEGANITSGSQGRVMLIAPTVVNKGSITAPDGQVILAAGSKVYLQASGVDDPNVRGLLIQIDTPSNVVSANINNTSVVNSTLDGATILLKEQSYDKLGMATNSGQIKSNHGNISMVGYAVNQLGLAHATTSVVANGTIYLMARDRAISANSGAVLPSGAARSGQVVIGSQSVTEVVPDVNDKTTSIDVATTSNGITTYNHGLTNKSQVLALGKTIHVEGGSFINAPSGNIQLLAVDNPSAGSPVKNFPTSLYNGILDPSQSAILQVDSGATISVAGLQEVAVSSSRDIVSLQLRGDELKDSPINQSTSGQLRGQNVNVNVVKALANANAGKDTLIAADSLNNYVGQLQRTVAERSITAGSVSFLSQGRSIIENGSTINVSGGSIKYTPAAVDETYLISNGNKLTSVADALSTVYYSGIASRFVTNYAKWGGRQEIYNTSPLLTYIGGYTQGASAGNINIFGSGGTYFQPNIIGNTVLGDKQKIAETPPAGFSLTLGYYDPIGLNNRAVTGYSAFDYRLNQNLVLGATTDYLPEGFKFGDVLPSDLTNKLSINSTTLSQEGMAKLNVYNNKSVTVSDDIKLSPYGIINLRANGIAIDGNLTIPSGAVNLFSSANFNNYLYQPPVNSINKITIGDNVAINLNGNWTNKLKTNNPYSLSALAGGSFSAVSETVTFGTSILSDGQLSVGSGTIINVNGGAIIDSKNKIVGGSGGSIRLEADNIAGFFSGLEGYGIQKAASGSLSITTANLTISDTSNTTTSLLVLPSNFLSAGGFSSYNLAAYDKLVIASNTTISPNVASLLLNNTARNVDSGSSVAPLSTATTGNYYGSNPYSLTLTASQKSRGLGSVILGSGSSINLTAGGSLNINAINEIEFLGNISIPGGTINANVSTAGVRLGSPLGNIWLGSTAVLDVSGAPLTYVDQMGLTRGNVLNGGTVNLSSSGIIISQSQSVINVSGAKSNQITYKGGLPGQNLDVYSNAGTITEFAGNGALLDGTILGHGNIGGNYSLTLGTYVPLIDVQQPGSTLLLSNLVDDTTKSLRAGTLVTTNIPGSANIGVSKIIDGGFDNFTFSSRDAIALENALVFGSKAVLPLANIKLDAGRFQAYGTASLSAQNIEIGNYDQARALITGGTPTGTSKLDMHATQFEVFGATVFDGIANTTFSGLPDKQNQTFAKSVNLNALPVTSGTPTGSLQTSGNVVFNADEVVPSSYVNYTINAVGHQVNFQSSGIVPSAPLSALGNLTINSDVINQGGALWAPFGSIALNATTGVTFAPGSLTSVTGDTGQIIPFGQTANGTNWVYSVNPNDSVNGTLQIPTLPGKSIVVNSKTVTMLPGSKVDISGGGNLSAYEFTVGPGGSKDILINTPNVSTGKYKSITYAIVPTYTLPTAPFDSQEFSNFIQGAKGGPVTPGSSISLSGVAGLPDGKYTLLPAHYALLPGAYSVVIPTNPTVLLANQAYTRPDGIQVVSADLTDSRVGAPQNSAPIAVTVYSQQQILARSQITNTSGSAFFKNTAGSQVSDAGLVSIATTAFPGNIRLDSTFLSRPSIGGMGAELDISAANLNLVTAQPSIAVPNSTYITIDAINNVGAQSVILGATTSSSAADINAKTLNVGASVVSINGDSAHTLHAPEILVASRNLIDLGNSTQIVADGTFLPTKSYNIVTPGAAGSFVRVASGVSTQSHSATSGSVNLSSNSGNLLAGAGVNLQASSYIALDATSNNNYNGLVSFSTAGAPVSGNLSVSAPKISFNSPHADGNTYNLSQNQLNTLNRLNSALFTSYTGFDLYGGVNIGSYTNDASNTTLNNLTLDGGYINGIANNTLMSVVSAKNLTLTNSQSVATTTISTTGTGSIHFNSDAVTLATGNKNIVGFSDVQVSAPNILIANNGSLTVGSDQVASLNISTDRINAQSAANQTVKTSGDLNINKMNSRLILPDAPSYGGSLSLEGSSVKVNSTILLNSGTFRARSDQGDIVLGSTALIDVSGITAKFYDATRSTWGGNVELTSSSGSVQLKSGSLVNVSGGASESGGSLTLNAGMGQVSLASNSVSGLSGDSLSQNAGQVFGANITIDTNVLPDFSALNTTINNGGFSGGRDIRVRGLNNANSITVQTTDIVRASNITLEADNGSINVYGNLNASGVLGGTVNLSASQSIVMMGASASIDVSASGTGKQGGKASLSVNSLAANALNLQSGTINLSGGPSDGIGGLAGTDGALTLTLPRNDNDIAQSNLSPINTSISGSNGNVNIVFNKTYNNIGTLGTAMAGNSSILGTATRPGQVLIDDIFSDNQTLDQNSPLILQRVNKSSNPVANIIDGTIIQSTALDIANNRGDLTLLASDPNNPNPINNAPSNDWEMGSFLGTNPLTLLPANTGSLVLRAAGNIHINSNLSDGFGLDSVTSLSTSIAPLVASNNSWSYTIVAGADMGASSLTRVAKKGTSVAGNINLAAGQLIRTGTGDIRLIASNNISFGDNQSVIYTAGKMATDLPNFTPPDSQYNPVFTYHGGDVVLNAGGNINGAVSTQLFNEWLFRQGQLNPLTGQFVIRPTVTQQTAWWVRFDQFQEGVGALGGGNVSVSAGRNIVDLSVSVPSQGRVSGFDPASAILNVLNTGDLTVSASGDIVRGQYYSDQGRVLLNAMGGINPGTVIGSNINQPGAVIGIGSGTASLKAGGNIDVSSVVNPFLLPQSSTNIEIQPNTQVPRSEFTTYSANTKVDLASLDGSVNLHQGNNLGSSNLIKTGTDATSVNMRNNVFMFPPTLSVVAYTGGINLGTIADDVTMYSSPIGNVSLLASADVKFNSIWTLADSASALIPTPISPASVTLGFTTAPLILPQILKNQLSPNIVDHSAIPVHYSGLATSKIYSKNGSVQGLYDINSLNLLGGIDSSTSLDVQAALDIRNLNTIIQQTESSQTSTLTAGRDILMDGIARRDNLKVWINGPGDLTVTAGRNINLGTSGGIESRGSLDNPNLRAEGANIHLNAGVGSDGLDYSGTLSRISSALQKNSSDPNALWQAQLLFGKSFANGTDAIMAINHLEEGPQSQQLSAVRNMVFQALSITGRDHNDPKSTFFGDYSRGYSVLDLVFPGLSSASANGKYEAYTGYINLFASRVKTDSGGNIDFMVPGGGLTVGLANTPQSLVGPIVLNNNVLGMVVAGAGNIDGFTRDSMLVNQSRILTVGGGDVLLWSSEGDIDAGKGKKSASTVPPPLIVVDANGNVKQVLQGAVGGSGIGALSSGSTPAGSVDLIAPKGTVNAGDAGIRAGNINIAAQTVLGADNITATGTSAGVPLADTSAVSAAAAGGATAGDLNKTLNSIASAASDAASAGQALANALKPAIVRVEVLGFGEQSN